MALAVTRMALTLALATMVSQAPLAAQILTSVMTPPPVSMAPAKTRKAPTLVIAAITGLATVATAPLQAIIC